MVQVVNPELLATLFDEHVFSPATLPDTDTTWSVAQMMNDAVLQLIDRTGSPNVYWALTGLPRPLIDMRDSLQFERAWPRVVFPLLADAETAERTP